MTPERELAIPPAPVSVENAAGHPAFGTYVGEMPEVDLRKLSGKFQLSRALRLLKHKRWVYTLVATPEVLAAFAIVDLSYTANAFAVAVDVKSRKVLFDGGFMGLPGPLARVGNRPGEGHSAKFRTVGAKLGFERGHGLPRYEVDLDIAAVPLMRGGFKWQGGLMAAGSPPALTVISPVSGGGVVNVTQKRAGMLSLGSLTAGGRTYRLDGGMAGMDYTSGYLARHTSWRWALGLGRMPDGTPVGLNLVEGINDGHGSNENALWIGHRVLPLGKATFRYNPGDLLDEWRVTAGDGRVDLRFRPYHVHRQERDYKLVKSRFLQPFGSFEGSVNVDGREIPVQLSGVTEEQDILW